MTDSPSKKLLDVPLGRLRQGAQIIDEVAIIKDGDSIRATRARCAHMHGKMRLDGKCRLRCPKHNWVLDLESMDYINPKGATQPSLRTEIEGANLAVYDDSLAAPWGDPGERRPLKAGEWKMRFYSHACMELHAGDKRLFTDPWLTGPAFLRGWWLAHRPPADWLERLASADLIYISHNHSDHLNPATLERLVARRPDVPIVVPDFESGSCVPDLHRFGFANVTALPFGKWMQLGDLRLMILQDRTDRDDSALLCEYAGRRLLNTVDCHNLGPLPDVDVLLAQHTRGASGYPVCWEELYGEEGVAKKVHKDLRLAELAILEQVEASNAKYFVPFAGYFLEAHASDADIAATNVKNSAEAVCAAVHKRFGIPSWIPSAGGTLDLDTFALTEGDSYLGGPSTAEMAPYIKAIEDAVGHPALDTWEGLQQYFDWAGFRGELCLHVLETDETFSTTFREFFVDFRSATVRLTKPDAELPYLRMKVRRGPFRHVLLLGSSWEEISIGFQARFFRSPDVYHLGFWDHFQHHLPPLSPFLQSQPQAAE